MFGPHLIIDGSRCDTRKLADRILVEQVLNDYPNAIGMTKIGGPYMFEYQAPDPAYSGVSGLVVIAESHIAIHTFPELDYFTMDIFSCKNFDHETAIEYIKKAFDVQEMDRMLIQRGLSFRGPHHGRQGATDELIAAAEARLAAGIISKEPALPDEPPPGAALLDERAAVAARHASQPAREEHASGGRMLWPQYGVTPDYGTYGETAQTETAQTEAARQVGDGATLPAIAPVLVNPTASISGLLDKMSAGAGAGRALGRALSEWERLVRNPDVTLALTLSTPMIAAGMRELLVYAVERRYVDVVVASADDLFADVYQALGYEHVFGDERPVAIAEGQEAARALLLAFLTELPANSVATASDLWRALGEALPTRAPRKGVLQAAAAAGVRIFTPDLATSAFGSILLAARAQGVKLALDAAEDVVALGRLLAQTPRLGVIRVGVGVADAVLAQAREVLPLLGIVAPTRVGSVSLDAAGISTEEHRISLAGDASLTLPLLVTGLAQRFPATRRHGAASSNATAEEPALA
ncbi:MAG: adenosylmethionine decarboxylase [Ktedonobacterales bacterium]|nr:adenosylmethionine decarboxylase [Ktedonobacterales bacterium]